MPELGKLTAALLVGGLGTRLKPVVADRPKILAEVKGRPFLEIILRRLIETGVRRAVLLTGYRGSDVQETLGPSYGPLFLSYSHEEQPLGTAGALRNAGHLFDRDPILVMNGDSYCNADLGRFLLRYLEKKSEAGLVLTRVPDADRFGLVGTDKEGRVTGFVEKGSCGPGWINAGIYLLTRKLVLSIPAGRPVSLEREMFPAWISAGVYGYKTRSRFLDIGTPETYARADEFFR
jgi:NDP-sugar pyrophosphorylase family protein